MRSTTSSVIRAISAATSIVALSPRRRPPLDQDIGGSHHRGCKIQHGLARKYRRNDAPLQTPLLALGAQQSIIQSSRQHPALQAILPIICGVIEQDAADRVRLVNQEHVPDGQSAGNDRLLEVLRGPAFQRVALQDTDQSDRLQRARLRLRRRRTKRRIPRAIGRCVPKLPAIGDDPFFRPTENLKRLLSQRWFHSLAGEGRRRWIDC